jgi:FixJ family two-component response regulator
MKSTALPPRFVPTLTDVVRQVENLAPAQPSVNVQQNPLQLEDQIVHRVMQRVDLVLERRLREAVAQVILSHTQTLGPRLREEIELVVRESVSQAVAQELPQQSQ